MQRRKDAPQGGGVRWRRVRVLPVQAPVARRPAVLLRSRPHVCVQTQQNVNQPMEWKEMSCSRHAPRAAAQEWRGMRGPTRCSGMRACRPHHPPKARTRTAHRGSVCARVRKAGQGKKAGRQVEVAHPVEGVVKRRRASETTQYAYTVAPVLERRWPHG